MAKIRQTTNWNDPAAAKKANEEIQKLASKMTGGNSLPVQFANQKPDTDTVNVTFQSNSPVNLENIIAIADRFYKRSYKLLDAVSKSQFDQDYSVAKKAGFSFESVRKLSSTGGVILTFGNDHNMACVYLAGAVKAFPADTLCINNFGGYLRAIDSTAISVPVLLYANKLFSESPIILTQLGNSYFELNDFTKAELYYKAAIKTNPGFGQAHSSLCDLYIKQNRLQEAIIELFAGVKGMGASYMQASNNFAYMQQQSESGGGKESSQSKEDFWNETRKQIEPADDLAPLVPEDDRVKMPKFPNCQKVEDWLEGGGWNSAFQSYQGFHSYLMSFSSQFLAIHQQQPSLPPNAILRDYPNERFALDCITEMFFQEAGKDEKKYRETVDKITNSVNAAKESYLKNLEQYSKQAVECYEGCNGNEGCWEECHRKFCKDECPNANKFNEFLRSAYNGWFTEFSKLVNSQQAILDDLYGFSGSWLNKIESPYWSRIYAYEIKRVALSIVGNCYADYAQTFQALSHNDCGTDCSIYANPYPEKPDEVNKKSPEGNECSNSGKLKIPIFICELGLDCESIEFGCAAGVAGSVKRNFRKKTTCGFLGVGVKGGAGFMGAGAKAGFEVTVNDNNEVEDVGAKVDISASVGVGYAKAGASATGSYTVMTGFKGKANFSGGPKL